MILAPGTPATLYVLLPYMWWEADDFCKSVVCHVNEAMAKKVTVMGQASTTGLISNFDLVQDESEEIYTNTKIVLFAFTWLLLAWQTIDLRKLVAGTTTIQALLVFAQILAPSTEILLIIRSLLGISGAIFPGALLSIFKPSNKKGTFAVATFVAVSPIGKSIIGPLISAVASFLKDTTGLNWRAIFAFQSILGLLVTIIVWIGLPSSTGERLSENIKHLDRPVNWKRDLMAFFKLRNIYAVTIFICCNLAGASAPSYLAINSRTTFAYVPYFFFTVFADLGPSHLTFNILLIGPYLLSILGVFIIAKISDNLQNRGHLTIACMIVSAIGFGVMSLVASLGWNEWWSYFAIYPACIGCYCAMTITIAWALGNERSELHRGLVLMMLLGAGQLAAMLSPAGLKPWWRATDEPHHPRGLGMCAALMAAGSVIASGLLCHLAARNRNTEKHSYAPLVDGYMIGEMEDESEYRYIV